MLTIADRIKYLRKQRGLTQAQLAEVTGIHPVSIRKYETNKMQPQPPQIERIASALQVNSGAISGSHCEVMRLQTLGDLFGLLMDWHRSSILRIEGERGADDVLKAETVHLVPNPILCKYLPLQIKDKKETIQLDSLKLDISEKYFSYLLKWESLYDSYQKMPKTYSQLPQEQLQATLEHFEDELQIIEMGLQGSTELLLL